MLKEIFEIKGNIDPVVGRYPIFYLYQCLSTRKVYIFMDSYVFGVIGESTLLALVVGALDEDVSFDIRGEKQNEYSACKNQAGWFLSHFLSFLFCFRGFGLSRSSST